MAIPISGVSDAVLGRVSGSITGFSDAEPGAARHYIFDSGDSSCLVDLVTGEQLTQIGGAPTYGVDGEGCKYVTLSAARGLAMPGLVPTTSLTIAGIAQYSTAGPGLFSSLVAASKKGWSVSMGVGSSNEFRTSAYTSVDGLTTTAVSVLKDLNLPNTPANGSKVFFAVSILLDGTANNTRRGMIGNQGYVETAAGEVNILAPGIAGDLAWGSALGGQPGGIILYEAMVFAGLRDFDFLGGTGKRQSLYERRKKIMKGRTNGALIVI